MDSNIKNEPIAIVGMGCRFPGGASNPDRFWDLLSEGRDAVIPVPKERWDNKRVYDKDPNRAGKIYMQAGGFLTEDIFEFDPLFFGISPREAETLDPQQRLLLEVTWEAFEDAGITDHQLKGSKTGVFMGGFSMDSSVIRGDTTERDAVDNMSAGSSSPTMLSNRLSYTFDLRGPSLSIDTACSSSLVATNYACRSIWSGESKMAIVGGVNVMLSSFTPMLLSKGQYISRTDRSMAFDGRASGYGRGEGAGVVILKPLSAAIADNDNIYALIKMTGANHDGSTPGVSVPSSEAQETLIKDVYKNAGIEANQVQYFEAHGTGTQVGDPKEATAINRVMQVGRDEKEKCLIGSVKTNIGHLEAAAGVAGLIKVCLSMKHKQIPASLHFENANPKIPFEDMYIELNTTLRKWPKPSEVLLAGINSFGYGGANAHAIVEQAPEKVIRAVPADELHMGYQFIPVSAKSEEALKELTARYAYYLSAEQGRDKLDDFIYTVSQRRSHHAYRLAIVVKEPEEIVKKLQYFSMGREAEGVVTGQAEAASVSQTVFVYTGMGPQVFGMGRQLLAKEPVFKQAMEDCDVAFKKVSGYSIIDMLYGQNDGCAIQKTELAQPANFFIQVALTTLWESWGVIPDAVVGHSVGEVTAAYISGALSLEDAVLVSYQRSQLQGQLANEDKAMLAIAISEEQAEQLIAEYDNVDLAAVNAPNAVTLSGDKRQLEIISAQIGEVFNRFLSVNIAYHSANMDEIKEAVFANLASINPRKASIPFYSSVAGQIVEGSTLSADYWWQNIRQTVKFDAVVSELLADGFESFVEVGPHPVLGHSLKEIALAKGDEIEVVPTLYRGKEDLLTMLATLAQLYVSGKQINWQNLTGQKGQLTQIPTYPWQKKRYWRETKGAMEERLSWQRHIFLNNRIPAEDPTWSLELSPALVPFVFDHFVHGQVVFPGTGYYEVVLAACLESMPVDMIEAYDFKIHKMLILEDNRKQFIVCKNFTKEHKIRIYRFYSDDEFQWDLLCEASYKSNELALIQPADVETLEALQGRIKKECSVDALYKQLEKRRLVYGASFVSIKEYWRSDNQLLARIAIDPQQIHDDNQYYFHPGMLDAVGHAALSIVPGDSPYVPVTTDSFIVHDTLRGYSCWLHVTVEDITARSLELNYVVYRDDGKILLRAEKVRCRLLSTLPVRNKIIDYVYNLSWEQISESPMSPQSDDSSMVLLLATQTSETEQLEQMLRSEGKNVIQLSSPVSRYSKTDYLDLIGRHQLNQSLKIFYAWPLSSFDSSVSFETTSDECLSFINLVQALIEKQCQYVEIILMTRASQLVHHQESINPMHNALWGLGLLTNNEQAAINVRCVDLDNQSLVLTNEQLTHLIYSKALDMAFRGEETFIQRLKRDGQLNEKIQLSSPTSQNAFLPQEQQNTLCDSDGCYIVIGGTKGVGKQIAKWLVINGAGMLVLVSRSRVDFHQQEAIRQEFLGTEVEFHQIDIADQSAVNTFFTNLDTETRLVKGVVHAATRYDDEFLVNTTKDRFDQVLAPKVAGVINIFNHLRDKKPQFLLLLSSLSSVVSLPKQASYIAANRFLDSFASYAGSEGVPTLALSLGPISDAGQVARNEALDEFMVNNGFRSISMSELLHFLEVVLTENISNIGFYDVNWLRWSEIYQQAGGSSRFINLVDDEGKREVDTVNVKNQILKQIEKLNEQERVSFISDKILEYLSTTTKMDKALFNGKQRIDELGIDSLMALDFIVSVKGGLGVEVSTATIAANPSLDELASGITAEFLANYG